MAENYPLAYKKILELNLITAPVLADEVILHRGGDNTVERLDLEDLITFLENNFTFPVQDHGSLTGLGDDDHTQYLTESRSNVLYLRLDTTNDPVTGKLDINDTLRSQKIDVLVHSLMAHGIG